MTKRITTTITETSYCTLIGHCLFHHGLINDPVTGVIYLTLSTETGSEYRTGNSM